MKITEMQEAKNKLVTEAKALLSDETRAFDAEQSERFDKLTAEADKLGAQIERMQKIEGYEAEASRSRGRITQDVTPMAKDELRAWLSNPDGPKNFDVKLSTDALRNVDERAEWESRALSHTNAAGGYTVPVSMMSALEVALLNHDGMRAVAKVFRTASGAVLPFPTVDDTDNAGAILAENGVVTEQDIVFGSKSLNAYKVTSKLVRVPNELIEDSAFDIAGYVGDLLGARIGRALSPLHTTGAGTTTFEGATVGAAAGITAATLSTTTWDELVDLEHSVPTAYRANASYVFSDATLKVLRKLKDSDNRPLWQPSMIAGVPSLINGKRYTINESMPELSTASAVSILFGDFSHFVIRDVGNIRLVRMNERFADYDQVGFVAFYRGDSAVIDAGSGPIRSLTNAAA